MKLSIVKKNCSLFIFFNYQNFNINHNFLINNKLYNNNKPY